MNELNELKVLWVSRPSNGKTGPMPTAYIGDSMEAAWESCDGCSLRDSNTCYAWNGTPRMGFWSVLKAYHRTPYRYSLEAALEGRHKKTKAARFGALGDPGKLNKRSLRAMVRKIRKAGLSIIGYTHHWRAYAQRGLKQTFMASCNSPAEADEAIKQGWVPAALLPYTHQGKTWETLEGRKGIVCPAMWNESTSCNECRLCDPTHKVWESGKVAGIGFIDHGPKARAYKRKRLPVAS